MKPFKVSVLIPAYNEEENIPYLIEEIEDFLKKHKIEDWEFILIDDGSTDKTYEKFLNLSKGKEYLRAYRYSKNQGKTKALAVGAKYARGKILVIFDADLQFTLEDAKRLVEKIEEGYDLIAGKKIGNYEKKFVSTIYNKLARIVFKVPVSDMNAMKAFKKEILEEIPLRKDWHRYIIPFAWEMGYNITELPVSLRKRRAGKSKYRGIGRIIVGFMDLIAVKFQLTFLYKPMLFFGTTGLISIFLGFLVGTIAVILRYGFNKGNRTLILLCMLLIISGLLLFAIGFIGEGLAGIYDRIQKIEAKIKEK
ncbi:MAG: glycosyltransferase family 2 protein [candidate division WOR-3 bacterium]